MAIRVVMPRLSDTMHEGIIQKWLKKEGDSVEVGEAIAEVETDKAVMEMESFYAGVIKKIIAQSGAGIPIGGIIAIIGERDEDISAFVNEVEEELQRSEQIPKPPAAEKPVSQEPLPSLAAPKTEKAGEPFAAPPQPVQVVIIQPQERERSKISPLARKLAEQNRINVTLITGTGPGGRIIQRDIEKAIAEGITAEQKVPETVSVEYEDIPLKGIRKVIAMRLVQSKAPIPHFYLTIDIGMDKIVALRDEIKAINVEQKISYNDMVLKIVSFTLKQHPEINARLEGEFIRRYKKVHLGVAVALEDGLITPVIRNSDSKGLVALAKELADLVDRAKQRKLRRQEYEGATFTVSNLGMYGIENFSAVINPPEGAILAVGAIEKRPVVVGDKIEIQHRMKVTISSDHRVMDGSQSAQFMHDLKLNMEHPVSLML